jgi:gamma-glutamyltranspeptidase/glutathione hydrolase
MNRLTQIRLLLLSLVLGFSLFQPALAEGPGKYAVASAHRLATEAGLEVLDNGGNAFDAAVAVSAALAVVEPASSGIGGGGFWLLHVADEDRQVMVDGRETAPMAATADMYLNEAGEVDRDKAVNGPLSAGIPGHPAAMVHLAENYGRLPLADSLAPAIRLAEEGFEVDQKYQALMTWRRDVVNRYPAAAEVFLDEGQVPELGFRVVQPDVAMVLKQLAAKGFDGFYRGEVAQMLVNGVRAEGGIWTLEDLAEYRAIEREPVSFQYGDFEVVTSGVPSAGGVVLSIIFQILSGYDLERLSEDARIHLAVEAMRRAYRDRNIYLGDPDFVDIPHERLLSPYYAAGLRASIRLDRATPSAALPGIESEPGGTDTTHFSVLDADGNAVSATLSVNLPYGSGFVAPGTGFLLNNEMDDFSAKAGAPNAYGLVGDEANAIEPGKRMLSSMSPSMAFGPNSMAVLGSPGGSTITTQVALGLMAYFDGEPVVDWVSKGRYHHQYLPDEIRYEPGALDQSTIDALQARGHTVTNRMRTWGNMHAIHWHGEAVEAASDPRWDIGHAEVREP